MSSTVRISQSLSDRLTERAQAKGSTPEELLDEMLQREEQLAAATAGSRKHGEFGNLDSGRHSFTAGGLLRGDTDLATGGR